MTRTETRKTRDGGTLMIRIRLGARLRQLRMAAGKEMLDAAQYLRVDKATISRIENGRTSAKVAHVRLLAAFYGAKDLEDELVEEAERGAAPGWWAEFGPEPWFKELLGRESVATGLDLFETELVPGLLQTEGYIRGFRAAAVPDATEEATARLVQFRLARQRHLVDGGVPTMRVILNEAVLMRPVGDPEAWRGQLEHIVKVASDPQVTVQVLPFSSGAHPAMGVPFYALTVKDEPSLDAVYLEDDRSGRQLTREGDLQRYRDIFTRLTSMSMSPDETVAYLSTLARNA
jgi:transcriptional regulator with XRE-family HTH domain